MRGIQYAVADRFNHCCLRNTGSPAFAGDDSGERSRGAMRPEFCWKPCPRNQRAQGRPGARRTRGLAGNVHQKLRLRAYRFGGSLRPSLRNGFTAYTISSWRPAFLSPSSASAFASADLTPAPGRRTQTISPYATDALVSRTAASTAPCPSFATMANAPLVGQDGGSYGVDLPDGASDLFFARRLDGPNHIEIAEEISVSAQNCRMGGAQRYPSPHRRH
jgi:hypothetical protein